MKESIVKIYEGGGKCEYVHFDRFSHSTKECSWKTNITRKLEKYSPEAQPATKAPLNQYKQLSYYDLTLLRFNK